MTPKVARRKEDEVMMMMLRLLGEAQFLLPLQKVAWFLSIALPVVPLLVVCALLFFDETVR